MNKKIYKTIEKNTHRYHVMQPDEIMGTTAIIVEKDGKALLIDTQFSKSDAQKIIDVLKEKNLELKTIYISHSDPDYYFGTSFIKEVFPDADILATRYTIARMKKSYASKLDIWSPVLKEDTPTKIIIPEIIYGKLLFEELEFQIVGQEPLKTSLFNAKDKMLLGGICVAEGEHLFLADTPTIEEQKQWIKDLQYFKKLQLNQVVPGHFIVDNDFSTQNLDFTEQYIEVFIEKSEKTTTSEELINAMKEAYPNLPLGNLELSAKVVKGEQNWDNEDVSPAEVLDLATEVHPFSGRTAEVLFETGYHFKLVYSEDNHVTWTSLSQETYGNSETEKIYVHKLSRNLYTVNWIESTGVSVSHNINLDEGTVWAFMSWNDAAKYGGRDVLVHGGVFSFTD